MSPHKLVCFDSEVHSLILDSLPSEHSVNKQDLGFSELTPRERELRQDGQP